MNIQTLPDQREIEKILGLGRGASAKRWLKRLTWLAVVALAIAGGYWWYSSSRAAANLVTYETAPVTRGALVVTVTATGTIQPTTQTDVSSELSGVVRSVNVDNNSAVKKGDVLAELDTTRYGAQLKSQQATLESARAKLADAGATLDEANLALTRQQSLQERGLVKTQDLESARAARSRAVAAVASAEADILVAEANLELKQLDILKSRIVSPLDGIVLKRAVEPGQTVASSLQAPVLFTLAEDLKRMQLEAKVDEADIGAVKVGQRATFTVDAFNGRNFPARIETIEYSPEVTEGVVTYKAILSVDNSHLSLRPGMTATAQIVVNEVSDALLVSNAALRYTPPRQAQRESFSLSRIFLPRFGRGERGKRKVASNGERTVWTLENNTPTSISVVTGATDGKMTEIRKGELSPQTPLITSARRGE